MDNQKKLSLPLNLQLQQLQAIFENAGIFFLVDSDGLIVNINNAGLDLMVKLKIKQLVCQ